MFKDFNVQKLEDNLFATIATECHNGVARRNVT